MPISGNNNNNKNSSEKLRIISLKDKPKDWTGKTWASQQGYLCSKGDILIFTDADTCYINKILSYPPSLISRQKI
jgi:hypothetical protein